MRKLQFVIGIICIAISIWGFVSDELSDNLVIPIVVLAIGIILIAISRRRK